MRVQPLQHVSKRSQDMLGKGQLLGYVAAVQGATETCW